MLSGSASNTFCRRDHRMGDSAATASAPCSTPSSICSVWCMATGDWELEVVKRPPGVRGWSQQPRRWNVERTFAWLLHHRRLVVDYERKVQTSETLIEVAMIRLLLARLGRQT